METMTAKRSELDFPRRKSSVRFTYEDYLQFPDDGKRFEIIDGELFMTPSPITKHQQTLLNLAFEFQLHLRKFPLGKLFIAPFDVVLSNSNVVQPDILFVSTVHESIITEKNISGAPDFIIEILSSSNSIIDLKRKRALYEMYGVKEYWIVNPEDETILKLHLENDQFIEIKKYQKNERISCNVINNFEIDVHKIFS